MTENGPDASIPDLPRFDDRIVRRAIRRGILSTAVTVALIVVVGAGILRPVSAAISGRGNRDGRFEAFLSGAVAVANPGYDASYFCCTTGLLLDRTATVLLRPRVVGSTPGETRIMVHLDALGQLRADERPFKTALESALQQPDDNLPTKTETTAILNGLPKGVVVTVVVRFAQPLAPDGYERVRARHNLPAFVSLDSKPSPNPHPSPPIGEEVFVLKTAEEMEREFQLPLFPIAWPGGDLGAFRRWAELLRPHDDLNLGALFLPSSRAIRQAAKELKIRAVALKLSARDVPPLLTDPQIAGIRLVDVGFDLRGIFF
jgi:hypothetical protein